MTDFHHAVKVACAIKNKTLTEVMADAGTSRQWFYNSNPTLKKVDAVAEALDMKTTELLRLGE